MITVYVKNALKAIINLAGLVSVLLSLNLIPAPYDKYCAIALTFITVIVHYYVPNYPAPGNVPAIEQLGNDVDVVPVTQSNADTTSLFQSNADTTSLS